MTDPISADNSSNPPTPEKAEPALPFSIWMRDFSRSHRIADLFQLADAVIGGSPFAGLKGHIRVDHVPL
jgi:hypothetical protein